VPRLLVLLFIFTTGHPTNEPTVIHTIAYVLHHKKDDPHSYPWDNRGKHLLLDVNVIWLLNRLLHRVCALNHVQEAHGPVIGLFLFTCCFLLIIYVFVGADFLDGLFWQKSVNIFEGLDVLASNGISMLDLGS
jgi:hypothetical protein